MPASSPGLQFKSDNGKIPMDRKVEIKTNFLIVLDSYEHYVEIQKKLFANGYCWRGTKNNTVKQSKLNPATHMFYSTETKEVMRFLKTHIPGYALDNEQLKVHQGLSSTSFLALGL